MKKVVMSIAIVCSFYARSSQDTPLLSVPQPYYQSHSVYPSAPTVHNYKANKLPELFQTVIRGDYFTFKSLVARHVEEQSPEVFTTLYGDSKYKAPFLIFFIRHLIKNYWESLTLYENRFTTEGDRAACRNSLKRFFLYAFATINFDYSVTDSLGRTVFHVVAQELFSPESCEDNNVDEIFEKLCAMLLENKQTQILHMCDHEGNTVLHTLVAGAINNHNNNVYCRKSALNYFKKLVSLGAPCHVINNKNQTPEQMITANVKDVDQAEKFVVARNTVLCWIFCPLAIFCGKNTLLYHSDATLLEEMLQVIAKK